MAGSPQGDTQMKFYLPLLSLMLLSACDGCGSDAEVAEEPAKSEAPEASEDEAPVDPAPESDKDEEASEDAEKSE
jgi:hypothetical protein